MKIRFYERKGFIGWLVNTFGRSRYYHVDIQLNNGLCIDSSPKGIRSWYEHQPFVYGPVVVLDSDDGAAMKYYFDHRKEGYGWLDCLLMALCIKINEPGQTCSEFATNIIFAASGLILQSNHWRSATPTPEELYASLNK